MEQKYTEDTFLAKWLNKELTEEDRLAFEKTPAFKDYLKIVEKMELFEAPNFDKEKVFQKIQEKTKKEPKVRRLIPNWAISVAASVAILIGLFFFMNEDTTYITNYGEQLAIVLPDGSEVVLNAKSSLSLDESSWEEGKRNLSLDGEGYFKVQKGSKFTVETAAGNVSVLGTQFNVKKTASYFEVRCFEGKVSVDNTEDSKILTPGKGYKKVKGNPSEDINFEAEKPSWVSGETTFTNVPISVVLKELEKQYNITFATNDIDVNKLFTGSFSNKNKELALQTVCIPMGIKYTIETEKTVVLKNK